MSGKNITRISLEDARKTKGKTDWDRVRSAGDYEGESEFEVDWSKAKLVEPETKRMISLRLDPDILDFFKAGGKGYQTRMNAVLRSYVEARQKAKSG